MANSSDYLRWFARIGLEDVPLVGGKNASLGELYRELGARNVHVPNGFALTVQAYYDALQDAGAWRALHALLDGLDITDMEALVRCGAEARRIVYAATGTETLRRSITDAYRQLEREYGAGVAVGRAQFGDGGGPAHREFRRPARKLSEHRRRR
jgi:pyruvate,water dikinase